MKQGGFVLRDVRLAWLVAFLAVAFVTRVATFGDSNIYIDESYYLLVGHEMHAGAVPYVDIWDRKPVGIFLLFWVFAALPNGVIAYQVGAWLSVGLTAFVISRIAARWMPSSGALVSGLIYIAMVGSLLGGGGQTPIYYNLLTATGAWLVIRYRDEAASDLSLYAAMLLFGAGIAFKQPVFFEAVFFGLAASLHHRNLSKTALQVVIGATPFLLIGGWYWFAGYWTDFYEAMVLANARRAMLDPDVLRFNIEMTGVRLLPIIGTAIYAFAFCRQAFPARFMALWLFVELLGFFSVPFIIEHYALPMMIPLSIVVAAVLGRRPFGPLLIAVVAGIGLTLTAPWAFERHRRSARGMEAMTAAVGEVPSGRFLLVYDGPPYLYRMVGVRPPTRLAFPGHLNNLAEKDVGPLRTADELRRLIAAQPYAVVISRSVPEPVEMGVYKRLVAYLRSCRHEIPIDLVDVEGRTRPHVVFSACGADSQK